MLFYEQEDSFADVVLPAELGWTFFAAQDLLDEFEFEFWWVNFAAQEISFGEGIPRSFRRGYWSQAPGFTSEQARVHIHAVQFLERFLDISGAHSSSVKG